MYIQGHPVNTTLLRERLFLEAELPFIMLDTKSYPTSSQGKRQVFVYYKEIFLFDF
jgi:hypothetical protein